MCSFKITIPFTPKAKGSWRLGKHGKYNPSCQGMHRTREYVRKHAQLQGKLPLMSGALLVVVHYRIPVPVSLPNKKRLMQDTVPHIKKPDGDNLEKFLNDALNGIVWTDDSNIAWMLRSKSLTCDKQGSTTIFVKQLDLACPNYEQLLKDIQENICLKEVLETSNNQESHEHSY